MTKSQELFFKAGLHKGRAEHWLERRKGHIPRTHAWLGFTKNMEAEEAKSERYLKRAEKEAGEEQHDLIVKVLDDAQRAENEARNEFRNN